MTIQIHCPECGYNLAGLPKEHRCPECGLPYNCANRVFEGRRTGRFFDTAIRVMLTFWIAGVVISAAVTGHSGNLAVGFLGVVILGFWWWAWIRRRKTYYVILSGDDITYREGGRDVLRVPLDDIGSAEYLSLSGEVALLDSDGQRIAVIPDLRAKDFEAIAEMCAAINERARGVRRTGAGAHVATGRSPCDG